jgi:proline iminopeptidase
MDAPCDVTYSLFPPIEEPNRSGHLKVDNLHTLYWEESGNPNGVPVVYLHGGPGEGAPPTKRQFWDPDHYRIILFDQRGALRSTPVGELTDNTTRHLVADIETLRKMLGVERWLVAGGSWGTTLALAYGEAHPERCLGFILRGVVLGTPDEIDWFVYGMRRFFPAAHEDFAGWIPEGERHDLVEAYARRVTADDRELQMEACRHWVRYSASCSQLHHDPEGVEEQASDDTLAYGMGRLDICYFKNLFYLTEDQLVANIGAISHLPCAIIQGGHDMIATPNSAYRLHKAWPGSKLTVVPAAGHSPMEAGTLSELIAATERFKRDGSFG